MSSYAEVAVLLPVEKTLTYAVPERLADRVQAGSCVTVPLGTRRVHGFVVGLGLPPGASPPAGIREIIGVRGESAVFGPALLALCRWASRYYLSSLGEVLRLALPVPPARPPAPAGAEPSPGPAAPPGRPPAPGGVPDGVREIAAALETGSFSPFLLRSEPGERRRIYGHLLEAALGSGRPVIALFRRIADGERFASEMGNRWGGRASPVALIHDGLPRATLWKEWLRARSGGAAVVVGSRSAVFSPREDPGLIIIDEEQDALYREERRPRYNARDVGLMRGKLSGATVVLGSTVPSVEAWFNAREGRYRGITVPGGNHPAAEVVDLRGRSGPLLSDTLREALRAARGLGPAVLFVHRKGFATSLFCHDCGYVPRCGTCGVPLVYHAHGKILRCPTCAVTGPVGARCPGCGGSKIGSLGAGTQRVEKEVRDLLPGARVVRVDRDTVGPAPGPSVLAGADVIVGTRIVADMELPRAALVGIVSADPLLNLPHFRAGEWTFQLLTLLSRKGDRCIIQSRHPGHHALAALVHADPEGFYSRELEDRQTLGYPPFSRLMAIRALSGRGGDTRAALERLARRMSRAGGRGGVSILGPAPDREGGRGPGGAWRLLVKGRTSQVLHAAAREALDSMGKKPGRKITLIVDIDP